MANEKRLIDANALQFEPDPWGGMNGVVIVGRSGGKTMGMVQAALKSMIDNAPTVDAVEVVHGRWVDRYGGKYANPLYECSACKNTITPTTVYKIEVDVLGHEHIVQALTNYCPNCGAKMYGERKDNETTE